jgi:hypothetical protein
MFWCARLGPLIYRTSGIVDLLLCWVGSKQNTACARARRARGGAKTFSKTTKRPQNSSFCLEPTPGRLQMFTDPRGLLTPRGVYKCLPTPKTRGFLAEYTIRFGGRLFDRAAGAIGAGTGSVVEFCTCVRVRARAIVPTKFSTSRE